MSDIDSDSDFEDDDFFEEYRKQKIAEMKTEIKKIPEQVQVNSGPIFISGPNTFVILKKGSQTIRMFGEWHGHEENCVDQVQLRGKRIVTITNYLENLLNQGNVDLYLEAPLLHLQSDDDIKAFYDQAEIFEKHGRQAPFLVLTRDALKWCLNPKDRNKCPFGKSRVHSTDIRPFTEYAQMNKELQFQMKQKEWDMFKNVHSNLINRLKTINNCTDYVEYITSLLDLNIVKQLQKSGIGLDSLQKALRSVCEKYHAVEYVHSFVDLLSLNSPPVGSHFNQEITTTVQEQISVLHDIYTVLRMMKPMDGKLQQNIVFYGGNAHVGNITAMLVHFGFEIVQNNSREIAKRCLQIN